jgi:hypothetical protein
MIAREFGDRALSQETVEDALREVHLEIEAAALRERRAPSTGS